MPFQRPQKALLLGRYAIYRHQESLHSVITFNSAPEKLGQTSTSGLQLNITNLPIDRILNDDPQAPDLADESSSITVSYTVFNGRKPLANYYGRIDV